MPILFNSENTVELITFDHRAIVKNPEPKLWRALTWINKLIGVT
ncbi:MAG TPA: hypothetical protein VIE65_03715 [Methylobacter sp.]